LIGAIAAGGTHVPCGVPVTTSPGVDVAVEVRIAVGDGVDGASGDGIDGVDGAGGGIGVEVTVRVEEARGVLAAGGGMVAWAQPDEQPPRTTRGTAAGSPLPLC
jgi:hypothetical protein